MVANDNGGDGSTIGGGILRGSAAYEAGQKAAVEAVAGARRVDHLRSRDGGYVCLVAAEAQGRAVFAVLDDDAFDPSPW